MCLTVDKKYKKYIEQKLNKNGYIIAYKILRYSEGVLKSPFRHIEQMDTAIISNRTMLDYNDNNNEFIYRGIHVYTNKAAIEKCYRIISPVICYKEDFVSAGHFGDYRSAVFYKVYPLVNPQFLVFLAKNKQHITISYDNKNYVAGFIGGKTIKEKLVKV